MRQEGILFKKISIYCGFKHDEAGIFKGFVYLETVDLDKDMAVIVIRAIDSLDVVGCNYLLQINLSFELWLGRCN